MAVHVKYFASLRDQLGRGEDQFFADKPLSVAEIWNRLCPDTPLPPNVLAAVNMEYTDLEHLVQDGDELAFFPPVTGG